jgi:hypothetical protein
MSEAEAKAEREGGSMTLIGEPARCGLNGNTNLFIFILFGTGLGGSPRLWVRVGLW